MQLNLSLRQLDRLKLRYEKQAILGLIHRSRGRPSNKAIPRAQVSEILKLIREHCPDFKPTLASEKLLERHGISISREKLRQLMILEGIWIR